MDVHELLLPYGACILISLERKKQKAEVLSQTALIRKEMLPDDLLACTHMWLHCCDCMQAAPEVHLPQLPIRGGLRGPL